jgi:microsomal epoxide hydrolase
VRGAGAVCLLLLFGGCATDGAFVNSYDGTRIHLLERGRPDAPLTLLFVPGWMLPGEVWHHQLEAFKDRYRVIAIDPRSQGDSQKVQDGNYPASRARDIRAVIEERRLERVVLIGASSGVTDIAAYVDAFGTRDLAAVVLVHGVPGADLGAEQTRGLLQWAQRFQTDRKTQTAAMIKSLFARPADPEYVQHLTRRALLMPTSAAMAAFFGSFVSDYRPALARIDRPALIIVADNAWMNQYRAMHEQIAGAKLEVIGGAGHALYIEAAPDFNARLSRFLEALPR